MADQVGFFVLGKVTELLVNYLVVPIKRQFRYLFCYNNDIQTLRDEVILLENIREDVEQSVAVDERNLGVILPSVQGWMEKVNVIKDEVDAVLEQTTKVEMRCLNGRCPSLVSRYSLSRKAMKKTQSIRELKQERVGFSTLTLRALPMPMVSVPTEGIKSFESRKSTTKQVMDALQDDEINMIGICGMGGVGKTTMVKDIAKKAKVENIFDEVVMTTVSTNQDLMKIQGDLASMLDLEFKSETNLLARADTLFTRLSNGKRILVILDDVWEELDLGKIGIPFTADHKGCKIVLTSRNERVCVDIRFKNIPVQFLTGDEGWDLFKEVAKINNGTNELQSIAKNVADECKGLPLAIVTLAKALKNEEVYSWNDTLRKLRRCNAMPEKVELSIELSYNMLKREEAKPLLLLCSLFPEDGYIPIECLVRYAIGLHLLHQIETVAEARDSVKSSIDHLKSRYLILGGGEETVRLHDVVRDVCISIASKDKGGYLVRCDAGLTEWPKVASYKDCTAISFKFDDLERVPIGLDCPNLKHLQLQCKYDASHYISPENQLFTRFDSGDFFEGMKELRIVALRSMSLHLKPRSFTSLMNLRTLCFDYCHLHTDTLILESLKNLEILSFFGSILDEFPSDIGELGSLRVLDLRMSKSSKPFPPGVLLKLCRLEELYMGDLLRERSQNAETAIIRELNSLSYLNTLLIEVSRTGMPELRGFCFENLTRFHILIEASSKSISYSDFESRFQYWIRFGYRFRNRFKVENSDMHMLSEIGIKVLLKRCEIVTLDNTKGLGRNLFDALDEEDSVKWKGLEVARADELEHLLCKDTLTGSFIFGNLQKLVLKSLPAMKSLFPCSLVKCFVQLKCLEIRHCEQLVYIVAKEEGGDENDARRIVFPKLYDLGMDDLPMLRSFYPNSDSLFHGQVDLPSMATMFIRKMGNVLHLAEGLFAFGNIQNLELEELPAMKSLFPCSLVKCFVQLQRLEISRCKQLEYIVAKEEGGDENDTKRIVFPKLNCLYMRDLPMLRSFYPNSDNLFCGQVYLPSLETMIITGNVLHLVDCQMEVGSFDKLRVMSVWDCNKLSKVAVAGQLKLFLSLCRLHVGNCDALVAVFDFEGLKVRGRDVEVTFDQLDFLRLVDLPKLTHIWRMVPKGFQGFINLTLIYIKKCDSLRYLLSPTVAKLLVSLQELELENCKAMKEIISMEQDGSETNVVEEMTTDKIVFSPLSSLKLVDLENLTVFCSGKYECQFPSLNSLVIRNCTEMKNFCSGPICTPELERGKVEIGKQRVWMGDLNTTIQCVDSSFTDEDEDEE